jgi:hypothetical protein
MSFLQEGVKRQNAVVYSSGVSFLKAWLGNVGSKITIGYTASQ